MHEVELVLGLLVIMSVLVALAQRLSIPYPFVLVIGGLLIGLIPGLPRVELDPDLVFLLFLPPIIQSAAFFTPIRDFRANLRPIGLLAVGLVLFTTGVVAVVAHTFIPELSWATAFVLGAIVSPPDAVAATSIAQNLNLPRRIVTVLEGESLLNDATSLVAYRVALAAVPAGVFSFWSAGTDFLVAAVGGVVVGVALGWLSKQIIKHIEDVALIVTLSFLVAFGAYIAAEAVHASGVLAVVVLGLILGRAAPRMFSSQARIQSKAVWDVVIFLLNGLIFILIGLQLPLIIEMLDGELLALLGYALLICATVIVTRLVWIFPATYLPRWLFPKIRERDPSPPWQHALIIGWTGMRGVVSLATALALPEDMPARNLILLLTFAVILATLLVQGLSLAPLIRLLGVSETTTTREEEFLARRAMNQAAITRLGELEGEHWYDDKVGKKLVRRYQAFASKLNVFQDGSNIGVAKQQLDTFTRFKNELLNAQNAALLNLRDEGTIDDEVMRRMQYELDLEQLRLDGA